VSSLVILAEMLEMWQSKDGVFSNYT